MTTIPPLTDTEIRLAFAALCVESAARRLGCTYREIYRRMHRVGLINNFILSHYDVNHTESRQVITDRLLECLDNWEAHQGITAAAATPTEKGGTAC